MPAGGDERGEQQLRAQHMAVTRIVLRPIGTPLPLGFLGLAHVATGQQ